MLWSWILGFAALILVFLFVWPTPYEYTRKAPDVYRVNRFTGITETATSEGWKTESDISKQREKERLRVEAELEQKALRRAEEEKQEKMALAEVKKLTEYTLRGTETKCFTSFFDGKLRFRLTLSPTGGLKRALSSDFSSLYYINLTFVDDQGFSIATERITLKELTAVADEKGRIDHYEFEGHAFVTADDYRRITGWEPTYYWGV